MRFYQEEELDNYLEEHPHAKILLAEGDSWLNYPVYDDLGDILGQKLKQIVYSKAHYGDEILQISSGNQKAKLVKTLEKYKPYVNAIFLSGGGNDIIGPNLRFLLHPNPEATTAQDFFCPAFFRKLDEVERCYCDLIEIIADICGNIPIFTHGYDYVIPSDKPYRLLWIELAGPWFHPMLRKHQIPDKFHQDIAKIMLDAFAEMLAGVTKLYPQLRFVPTAGTLEINDWNDEIHPKDSGLKKLVKLLLPAMTQDGIV